MLYLNSVDVLEKAKAASQYTAVLLSCPLERAHAERTQKAARICFANSAVGGGAYLPANSAVGALPPHSKKQFTKP